MPTKKKEDKEEKKTKKTVSKKTTTAKPAKEKHVAKASKPVKHTQTVKEKAVKKHDADVVRSAETQASENELMPKVQCYNHGKKTICAHLILATHKCTAKRIAPDRLATVRIGKKRRCEFYEETTLSK